ncbi:hypothetical protein L6R53_08285 [Myxococcota bacterium]|nr:hypothetical protein [Myxococcota bacterium]
MNRWRGGVVVLVVVGLLSAAVRLYWTARLALLPALEPSVLNEVPASPEAQREHYRAWAERLQCEALDPCLALLRAETWESEPARIAAACGQSGQVIEGLVPPTALPDPVRAHMDLLRSYWQAELERTVDAARGGAGGLGGLWHFELDTCTADSVPARLDQLYGLVPPGSVPATCDQLRQAGGGG